MINALLIRWANGWREVVAPASVALHGRREALLGLGAVGSTGEVDRLGARQLATYADARTEITAEVHPASDGDRPYVAFAVGDTITVPALDGGTAAERVVALTVSVDENGTVGYAPELKDVLLEADERVEQAIKKMADGTLRGQSKIATPVGQPTTKPVPVRPVVNLGAPGPTATGAGTPGLFLSGAPGVANGTQTPLEPYWESYGGDGAAFFNVNTDGHTFSLRPTKSSGGHLLVTFTVSFPLMMSNYTGELWARIIQTTGFGDAASTTTWYLGPYNAATVPAPGSGNFDVSGARTFWVEDGDRFDVTAYQTYADAEQYVGFSVGAWLVDYNEWSPT